MLSYNTIQYSYLVLIMILGIAMIWLQSIGGRPWAVIPAILLFTNNVYWIRRLRR